MGSLPPQKQQGNKMEKIIIENKRAFVKINGAEYDLKFTVGFWKQMKASCGVTQENLESKLREDFALVATKTVLFGIKYSLPAESPMPITEEQIERELDRSVMDVIEQAYINGMTKQEREITELLKNNQAKELSKIGSEEEDPTKKKSQ